MSEPREPDPGETTPLPKVPGYAAASPNVHGRLPVEALPAGAPGHEAVSGASYPQGLTQQYGPETATARYPDRQPASGSPRSRPAALRYTAYGLVLVAVAVISGLIWWAAHPSRQPPAPAATGPSTAAHEPAGTYQFAKAHGTVRGTNCEAHSYGKTRKFFADTPCRSLSRTVYWTRVDGARVFSGVRVITMRDAADAAALEHLTDTNGTGNVTDLLKDGIRVSGAPDTVKGGAYASARDGDVVTIVESKPEVGKKLPAKTLEKVSRDALRLGKG